MGGASYDRDVYSSSSTGSWSGSTVSHKVLSKSSLDSCMLPTDRIIESTAKTPIVILLDVTGSNIAFARIVYDKMPMLYGQIEQQGYLEDFDISVCAVGDAYCDRYPLQVADFAKGAAIDDWLSQLVLEGGGGGQFCESYELAAYYMYRNTRFRADAKPILFYIADEAPYDTVNPAQAKAIVSDESTFNGDPFPLLREKFGERVFLLKRPYNDATEIAWSRCLPSKKYQQIIRLGSGEERSVVDLILGIIALMYGTRSVSDYKVDMINRGQDDERVRSVTKNLNPLEKSLALIQNVSGLDALKNASKRTSSPSKRL
ncbi:MAG: hypothetical protein Q4C01_01380 [Clostridia bacterium]|nr:hypothetical protein [Clostridia bacterium]